MPKCIYINRMISEVGQGALSTRGAVCACQMVPPYLHVHERVSGRCRAADIGQGVGPMMICSDSGAQLKPQPQLEAQEIRNSFCTNVYLQWL
ncbi:hypothetical protein XELAEV_18009136mg [Xenopus laevis]|uniref:Uncharacterized protein n=1 Tax=Xenopus laevis TaxID=8355 RepID=A0A974I0A4_XENLA|nr:hypothetical protein XELAEV_18009136mg [Xenopus laevis]